MCESVMTHRGVETDYDSGASRVMTTEAVTALASAAVITTRVVGTRLGVKSEL